MGADTSSPEFALGAFIIPNARIHPDDPITKYQVDKSVVDYLSGSTLFPDLEVKYPHLFSEILPNEHFLEAASEPKAAGESLKIPLMKLILIEQLAEAVVAPNPSPAPGESSGSSLQVSPERAITFRPPAARHPIHPNICHWSSCELPPPNFWQPVTDQAKITLQGQVKRFSEDSTQTKLDLSPTLTPAERKVVHAEAEKYGLKHFSVGGKADRHIVLEKASGNQADKE